VCIRKSRAVPLPSRAFCFALFLFV
jgi:hypothetical protein